jgi:hypothetical protein
MPPAQRGAAGAAVASASNVANPTNLAPPLPAHQPGDLLLCYTACRATAPAVATPAGWTQLLNVAGTVGRLALFGKVAASASETNPTVTWSGLTTGTGGTPVQAQCAVFTATQLSIDVLGTVENLGGSTTLVASGTAITTLTADDLVLSLSFRPDDVGTWSPPAGNTLIGTALTTSGADMAFAWSYRVTAASGSVAPADYGISGAVSQASTGIQIALRAVVSTAHTRAPADGLALTDTEAVTRGHPRAIADGLALADAETRVASWKRSRADGFALTDQATPVRTPGAQAHSRTVADGFALTDARRATHAVTVSDQIAFADAAIPAATYRRTRADGLALADSRALARTRRIQDALGLADARTVRRTRTIADGLALTDASTAALIVPPITRAVADGLALEDGAVFAWTAQRPADDQLQLSDQTSRSRTASRALADGLALTDQRGIARAVKRTWADGLALTDQATRARALRRSRADGLALTDQATPVETTGSVPWARSLADQLSLSDSEREARGKRIADVFVLTDARRAAHVVVQQDGIVLADVRVRATGLRRALADGLALSDSVAATGAGATVIADAISFADALALVAAWRRAPADTLALGDALARARGILLGDGFALVDAAAVLPGALRRRVELADVLVLTDRWLRPYYVGPLALALAPGRDRLEVVGAGNRLELVAGNELEVAESGNRLELVPSRSTVGSPG